jgi:hypothetical protein
LTKRTLRSAATAISVKAWFGHQLTDRTTPPTGIVRRQRPVAISHTEKRERER